MMPGMPTANERDTRPWGHYESFAESDIVRLEDDFGR